MTKTFTKNENLGIQNRDIIQMTREIELDYLDMKIFLDRFNAEPSSRSVNNILEFSKRLN